MVAVAWLKYCWNGTSQSTNKLSYNSETTGISGCSLFNISGLAKKLVVNCCVLLMLRLA